VSCFLCEIDDIFLLLLPTKTSFIMFCSILFHLSSNNTRNLERKHRNGNERLEKQPYTPLMAVCGDAITECLVAWQKYTIHHCSDIRTVPMMMMMMTLAVARPHNKFAENYRYIEWPVNVSIWVSVWTRWPEKISLSTSNTVTSAYRHHTRVLF
jgi:hypothetical protein